MLDFSAHKKASDNIKKGIELAIKKSESNDRAPTEDDVVHYLNVLRDKMKESEAHIGVPFYQPIKKSDPTRTTHDFKRDIMGNMKEYLMGDTYCDNTSVMKYIISPIIRRLSLFSHQAAIESCDLIIDNAIKHLKEYNPPQ